MSSKSSAERAAQYLDNLSVRFNEKADENKSAAALLETVAGVLRKQQEENQKLQRQLEAVNGNLNTTKKLLSRTADIARADKSGAVTLRANVIGSMEMAVKMLDHAAEGAVVAEKPAAAASIDVLNVLIDGSGSMTSTFNSGGSVPPLSRSLEAVLELSNRGKNVATFLWGSSTLASVSVTPASLKKLSQGLLSGTSFSPVVNYMKDTRQSQSFVIISDGDLEEKDAVSDMEKLLESQPQTVVDFVVVNDRKGTPMARLAEKLAGKYSNQVTLRTAGKNDNVTAILAEIAAVRGVKNKPEPKQYYMTTNKIPGLK